MAEQRKTFTYEEALATFPTVQQITTHAVQQVQALYSRVQSPAELEDRSDELESAANTVIEAWVADITGMGCEVKGLWLVDWDCGDGYYCWRYPEESLAFFHGYDEGFEGRVPIA